MGKERKEKEKKSGKGGEKKGTEGKEKKEERKERKKRNGKKREKIKGEEVGKEELEEKRKLVERILEIYPDEKLDLRFRNAFELLIATIFAARSRDEVVNEATEGLFQEYDTPEKLAKAKPEDLKKYVSKINFWYKKAKTAIEVSKEILRKYGGNVPDDVDELTKLKGVGRKTANMVVGAAYGKPAIIVDTHFITVSSRLGFVKEGEKPEKIEEKMREIIPEEKWTKFSLALMRHGKLVCHAISPKCEECKISETCKFYKERRN